MERRAISFMSKQQRSLDDPKNALSRLLQAMIEVKRVMDEKLSDSSHIRALMYNHKSCQSGNCSRTDLSFQWLERTYEEVYMSVTVNAQMRLMRSFATAAYHSRLRTEHGQILSTFPTLRTYMDKTYLIGYLVRRFGYSGNFLEIGCSPVDNLVYARYDDTGISSRTCVDPETSTDKDIGVSVVSVRATSDEYFKMLDEGKLDSTNFDIILVDGLHEAEQVFIFCTNDHYNLHRITIYNYHCTEFLFFSSYLFIF